jgi:hypothetical protein
MQSTVTTSVHGPSTARNEYPVDDEQGATAVEEQIFCPVESDPIRTETLSRNPETSLSSKP